MKKYAAVFKNIAAILLLVALISLLLPFGKVTTGGKSTTISGVEILKVGVDTGYEYYSKGTIDNQYDLWDGMTWGDMKQGITYAMDQYDIGKIVVCSAVASLPIFLCFFAMLFIFMARGKKMMLLSTLMLMLATLENVVLVFFYFKFRPRLQPEFDFSLLIGSYSFILLGGIAFLILALLWITGGFFVSEEETTNKNRKKRQRRPRKKRKKRRKKSKRKSRRRKYTEEDESLKIQNEKPNETTTENQIEEKTEERKTENQTEEKEIAITTVGQLTGLTGFYQGMNVEITKLPNKRFLIGTTKEAVEAILTGKMEGLDRIAKAFCVITYYEEKKKYEISSHSAVKIVLQIDNDTKSVVYLNEGDRQMVGANTLLYVGGYGNCIQLK